MREGEVLIQERVSCICMEYGLLPSFHSCLHRIACSLQHADVFQHGQYCGLNVWGVSGDLRYMCSIQVLRQHIHYHHQPPSGHVSETRIVAIAHAGKETRRRGTERGKEADTEATKQWKTLSLCHTHMLLDVKSALPATRSHCWPP